MQAIMTHNFGENPNNLTVTTPTKNEMDSEMICFLQPLDEAILAPSIKILESLLITSQG